MAGKGGGVNVRLDVKMDGFSRKMVGIAKKVDNMSEPMKNSGIIIEQSIAKRFRSGGGSRPWARLAPSTIKRHPHRAGGKPLNDTGRLRSSVTAGANKRVSGKKLHYTFGSGVEYAAIHNFGGRHIPQREFLYLDPKDEQLIKRLFEDYIRGVVNS